MKPNEQPVTWDGKHTIEAWWRLARKAQITRGKARLFEDFWKPYDLVFDVGAARGMMTMVFRWLGAQVVCVDPMYAVAPHLVPEFDWKFSDDPYTDAVAKAISPLEELEFWVNNRLPYLSSGNPEWMWGTIHQVFYGKSQLTAVIVETTTLDALVEEFGEPKFIKVDVEGDENNVVPTLHTAVGALNMEFHQDWIPTVAIDHMDTLADYEWNYVLNNSGVYVCPSWQSSGAVLDYMRAHLEERGLRSWGDLYCRRRDVVWP